MKLLLARPALQIVAVEEVFAMFVQFLGGYNVLFSHFSCRFLYWGNLSGGLANGGGAEESVPISPKRAPEALQRLQSGPKRPDFPGRIFARFSLKIRA